MAAKNGTSTISPKAPSTWAGGTGFIAREYAPSSSLAQLRGGGGGSFAPSLTPLPRKLRSTKVEPRQPERPVAADQERRNDGPA
jgi:hypothetical protein